MAIRRHCRPLNVEKVKLIRVCHMRGDKSLENPERLVSYYYTSEGAMVACYDEINGKRNAFMPLKPGQIRKFCDPDISDADPDSAESIRRHFAPLLADEVELIKVTCLRGDNTPENPERQVNYYYGLNGIMEACFDPINGKPDWFMPVKPGEERVIGCEEYLRFES